MGHKGSKSDPFGFGVFDGGDNTWDRDGDGELDSIERAGRYAFDQTMYDLMHDDSEDEDSEEFDDEDDFEDSDGFNDDLDEDDDFEDEDDGFDEDSDEFDEDY
ncbi:MAG: hypothetical protein U0L49_00120 [Eubacterium sp.]|nr:hypothetical protein [Eubacterium sp.]